MKFSRGQAIVAIATACHAANKAYCESIGDRSQPIWTQLPAEIQAGVINGVEHILDNPDVTPEESHNNWMEFKKADGWVYGETKSLERKCHPRMRPFDELPLTQRVKDTLFKSVVKALIPAYTVLTEGDEEAGPEKDVVHEHALVLSARALTKELGLELEEGRDILTDEFVAAAEQLLAGEEVGHELAVSLGLEVAEDDEDLPAAAEAFKSTYEGLITNE